MALSLLVALPAGWLLGWAVGRLPARTAAGLAFLLGLAVVLPLPLPPEVAEGAASAGLVALPLAWGLRRRSPAARAVLATLAGPGRRACFWLPNLAPWLVAGPALALARAGLRAYF